MNKILIVDDSSTMRRIITRMLRQSGISVDTILEAGDGVEGLEQVASNPDVELILSDVNMPKMNGIEFVIKIREQHSKDELPIIMITTEGGEEMRNQALSGGANGYVAKPFTPEVIGEALGSYVK